jgi:hypothetical protein
MTIRWRPGALALAIGAAIGLAVRATEYEDRAMGATRDETLARARHVANNLKQNVTDKVATYAEDVVSESLLSDPAPPGRRWGERNGGESVCSCTGAASCGACCASC